MFKRIISFIVLIAFVNLNTGCVIKNTEKTFKEELQGDDKIVSVIMPDGKVITFNKAGGKFDRSTNTIRGFDENQNVVTLDIDDILYARVSRTDVGGTFFATVGVLALGVVILFLIVALTKESCPFVYSYDGEKFVLDAEPLGGAVCRGLQKTDYSRLEHVKAVNDQYQLVFRNEVEETQYLDDIRLVYIDHQPDEVIIPDLSGNMQVIMNPVAPVIAVDENGSDLKTFVGEKDGITWQTHFPEEKSGLEDKLQHQLIFKFPKPVNAGSAQLLVNAGTGLWGSNMIREMLQLRGDKVDDWYEAVNNAGHELLELVQFIEREQLYLLGIQIQQGSTWVRQGFIPGGGPLITEDRSVPIDLRNVDGDTLKIKLNPPYGFWNIDYIAVQYQDYPAPQVNEITLQYAENSDESEIRSILTGQDNRYHEMPEVGNWFKVNFNVPAQQPGTKRSLFLKTTGYYEIHIDKTQPEQTELINQLLTTPGAIVSYAMDQYIKWRHNILSSN